MRAPLLLLRAPHPVPLVQADPATTKLAGRRRNLDYHLHRHARRPTYGRNTAHAAVRFGGKGDASATTAATGESGMHPK
eukprot:scaffold9580_cov101-Isochrysis_galbana.AAC.1